MTCMRGRIHDVYSLKISSSMHEMVYTNAKQRVRLRRSDVTNHAGLQATFDEIVKDFGRIDGL